MQASKIEFQHLSGNNAHLGILAELYTVVEPVVAHSHDFWEIAFAVKGSGHHEDDRGRLPILLGDVWILRPGQWHAYPLVGQSLCIFNLLLSRDFLTLYPIILQTTHSLMQNQEESYQPLAAPVNYMRLSRQGLESIYELLRALESELRMPTTPGHACLCVGLVLQILGSLDRYGATEPFQSAGAFAARHDPGLLAAVQCIEQRYAEPLTLEEIAGSSGYAPTYLARKFHQQLGVPPIDYLLQVRLQHACTLLKTTKLPVITIAHSVGFIDSRYFATRFRRALNLTPSAFRLRHSTA